MEAIRDSIEQLRVCTAAVKAKLAGMEEYDDRLASHLAWVTQKMASCLDSIRKQEAAERARWKTMGMDEETELFKVWLDECPAQSREEILAHLMALGRGAGLLS